MSDIFISYARKDQPKAKRLADALTAVGWSVWWDPKIQSGKAFDRVIETAIAQSKCVVVVWSRHSVDSDWVRAEAANGLSRGILISVAVDEGLELPLRFSQVHTEDFSAWEGDTASPQFAKLMADIGALVGRQGTLLKENGYTPSGNRPLPVRVVILVVTGLLLSGLSLYLLLNLAKENRLAEAPQQYVYLFIFCAATSFLALGLLQWYAHRRRRQLAVWWNWACLAAGILLTTGMGLLLPQRAVHADLTIRVLDKYKRAVTEGNVKLGLPGVQEQALNKAGEVRFEGVPKNQLTQKIKVQVSSPGYSQHTFDTVLQATHPQELILTQSSVIKLAGRVEDAGEMPIRNVEVSVENTRFYTRSLTDGTYFLTLTDYANGDEVVLRTSHPGYEDKLVRLAIKLPETQVPDIVLKPVN